MAVDKMTLRGSRLEADVIIGSVRHHAVLSTEHADINAQLQDLFQAVERHVRKDLAGQLDLYLSAPVRKKLTQG